MRAMNGVREAMAKVGNAITVVEAAAEDDNFSDEERIALVRGLTVDMTELSVRLLSISAAIVATSGEDATSGANDCMSFIESVFKDTTARTLKTVSAVAGAAEKARQSTTH